MGWNCQFWQKRDFSEIYISISWNVDFVNLRYTGFVYNPVYKLISLCRKCRFCRFWAKSSILLIFVNFDKFDNFWVRCWSLIVYFESTISLRWCSAWRSILRSLFVKVRYLILNGFGQFGLLWMIRFVFKSWFGRRSSCRLIVDSNWAILVLEVLQKLIKIDQFWSIFLQIR